MTDEAEGSAESAPGGMGGSGGIGGTGSTGIAVATGPRAVGGIVGLMTAGVRVFSLAWVAKGSSGNDALGPKSAGRTAGVAFGAGSATGIFSATAVGDAAPEVGDFAVLAHETAIHDIAIASTVAIPEALDIILAFLMKVRFVDLATFERDTQ
jgi:hypothetical protein